MPDTRTTEYNRTLTVIPPDKFGATSALVRIAESDPAGYGTQACLNRADCEWLRDRLDEAIAKMPEPFPFEDGDIVEHLDYNDLYYVRDGKIHYSVTIDSVMAECATRFHKVGHLVQ